MTGAHPSDLELFEYVEDELEPGAAEAVHAHVEACAACAASVAELERGRSALRASPLLELPELRRRAIFAGLPEQERDHRPFPFSSPKRLLAVLTPIAAVAAVAVALVTATGGPGGGGGEEATAAAKTADELRADAAPAPTTAETAAPPAVGGAEDTTPMLEATPAPVLSVAGPPADVAGALTAAGYPATVRDDGAVEVSNATEAEVKEILFGRPAGDVPVFLAPPG